jgi:hypothetical protein
VLAAPSAPGASAHRLTEVAFGQGGATWAPVRRLLSTRDIWLRNTWVRYDGGQALAVGKLQALDRAAGVYWVALDGAPLEYLGRVLLFATRERAQHAATLAAASRCMQQFCSVVAAILSKPADDITEADLPGFDRAMAGFRGAVRLAAADWGGRPIAFPVRENLNTSARQTIAIIAELIDVGLNTPAAAMTVQ